MGGGFASRLALKASEGTRWTNGSSGGWVGACVRGRCLRVRPAPYVDRRGVAPLARAWPDPLAYLARAWPDPLAYLARAWPEAVRALGVRISASLIV